jgi:transglutaminase-like putative cysteine protease
MSSRSTHLLSLLALMGLIILAGSISSARAQAPEAVLYLPLVSINFPPPSTIHYTHPQVYRVTKGVTFTNTGFKVSSLYLYLPYPIDWDSQVSQLESLSPYSHSVAYDPTYGNGILTWMVSAAPASGESLTLQETFLITVTQVDAEIYPGQVQPYDTAGALYQLYTRSEPYLESSDPLVESAARAAVGSETNPYLQARLIYQYTIDHLFYQNNDALQGARRSLELGHGECGDYAAVFVALARAAGVPSRPVSGYWAASGESYHVWAEFYLQGVGWIPVDANQGEGSGFESFGRLDNQRIAFSKGYNIPIAASPIKITAPLFQTYYWLVFGSGTGLTRSEIWTVEQP